MTRSIERAHSGQIIPKEKKEYNERLFKKGWRRYLHESRYLWLRKKMKQLELADVSILELGCFDAKTIGYLPFGFSKYVGYDANWENGLDLGKKKWKNNPAVQLVESNTVSGFNTGSEQFDCAIAMETLEHLKAEELEQYIAKLAAATKQYLFISVPYERGAPLLLKYLYKALRFKVDEPYSLKELFYGVKGDLSKVGRIEGGHKGFDHRQLLKLISGYFEIKDVAGLPFSFLPAGMNFSVGIIAVPLRS
jgi:hypothetical protein